MTQTNLSAPGVGLPYPQNLYPTEFYNAPYDFASNAQTLAPGDAIALPAGKNLVWLGQVSVLQFLDPVTGVWRIMPSGERGSPMIVDSDGFTRRVANLTGCPVAACVTGQGSGYTAATAIVSASAGGSTWQPIVGGQLSVISVVAGAGGGSNYGVTPLVLIAAPASPGVQATAAATISAGTVASVSLTNVGAGYASIPNVVILPNPTDPNLSTITNATVSIGTIGSGKITAVLCTNSGAAVSTAPTLTASGGAGTGATISAVMLNTCTSIAVPGVGGGYTASSGVTSFGGTQAAGAATNPLIELVGFRARPLQALATVAGTSISSVTINDGGLFAVGTAPVGVVVGTSGTLATVSLTMGSINDTVMIQTL